MIVVDSSVAFKWIVEEAGSASAAALIGEDLIAPDLLLAECGNAMWKLLAKGHVDEGHALASLATLDRFVRLVPATEHALRAFTIAAGLNHPVYDCYFLAVAEQFQCELITADVRLIARCANSAFERRVRPLA